MANSGNLKPNKTLSAEEAKRLGTAGGKKSGEVRRARKSLRKSLKFCLKCRLKAIRHIRNRLYLHL